MPADLAFAVKHFDLSPECPIMLTLSRPHGPGQFGADMHLAFELGLVVSGSLERNHGAGWFRVGVGQAYACTSFQPHQWRFPASGVGRIVFQFLPSLFQQMPALAGFDPMAPFRVPAQDGPIGTARRFRRRLADLGRKLTRQYRSSQSSALPGPMCLSLIGALGLISAEVTKGAPPATGAHADAFTSSRINPALELISNNPGRRVRLGEGARACSMARSTFVRQFKRVTGLGFVEFGLRWRLSRAAHSLRATDWPIKAIAQQCGFRYRSYFSRVFTAHYGLAPAQYRSLAE